MSQKKTYSNDFFAKKLMVYLTGSVDEEEFETICGITADEAWDLKPQWEQDDYKQAAVQFTELIMDVFEEV